MAQSDTSATSPKPLGKLFKWLRIFFIIYIISEALLAVGSGLMLRTGSVMFGPGQPLTLGDVIQMIGSILLLISFIVCIVLFSIFSYRAVKNLHILGVKHVDISPGWAVGWYFIPIANLWKPYGAMTEMWMGTHSDAPNWEPPKTMPIWWICWIVSNIASNVSLRMGVRAGMFEEYVSNVPLYKTTLYIDIASAATGIIAAWIILKILGSIAETQDLRIHADPFD